MREGNDTPRKREDFPAKVKPILVNKDVQKLFSMNSLNKRKIIKTL